MRLPQYTDYQLAVQNPQIAFRNDPELARCRVQMIGGGPFARTGNFAFTYCLQNGGKQWAVRCFSKYDPGQRRYEAIGRFLRAHPCEFFVPTEYRSQGILVNGGWFPITKTLWMKGETLEVFIDENIKKQQVLSSLLDQFQRLIATLEDLGIAHGDLQHGNILVNNGRLILIDYDGMYVPELKGSGTEERGHPDYQHPARNVEYGPHLDRFSSIVIFLTLKALAAKPDLWRFSAGGDHLILKQRDFLSPDGSPPLRAMEEVLDLGPFVQAFRNICRSDFAEVPRLIDFLSGKIATAPTVRRAPASQWGQYDTLAATDRTRLLQAVGQKVTIVGQIVECTQRTTTTGQPYFFLNFGDWRQSCLTLVLWSEAIRLFETRGQDPAAYKNKWVSVTGLLTQYQKGSFPARPQIIVSSPSEIEVLEGAEREARDRIAGRHKVRDASDSAARTESHILPLPGRKSGKDLDDRVQAHIDLGRREQKQGRPDKAIHQYAAALRIAPDSIAARSHLIWAYQQQGRYNDVLEECQIVLRLQPNDTWAWKQLGWAHAEMGRFDSSIRALQSALRVDPDDADAHGMLAWVYRLQGRLTESIEEGQRALSINPESDSIHTHLGIAQFLQGSFEQAIAQYQMAIRINPDNASAHRSLGLVYAKQGRIREARVEARRAAELGDEFAKQDLRELHDMYEASDCDDSVLPF